MRRAWLFLVLLLGCAILAPAARSADPAPAADPLREAIDQAITRGVRHLLATQRKDGSWGGPAPNLHVDIYAPVPGSNRAFTVGASALALSALVETGGDAVEVRAAIERGTQYLLRHCIVRRQTPDTLYNVWGLMYCLETFARLLERETREGPRARLLKASESCVAWLDRMEFVEGGWGYFNFDEQTRDPGPGATSFTTATGVVALARARAQGVEIPEKLLRKANALIRRCAIPGGSFAYSFGTRLWGIRGDKGNINFTQGSLARTPACLLAWALSGEEVDPARFPKALDELETYGHFLRIARKYPFPHETWYQNSGYFCLYGYYYAAMLMELLPDAKRSPYKAQIAGHLLKMQEKEGSWWDYQLYQTHKPYGTAYALMALQRCR